ncbi:MAG TPA: ABC transporter permease [Stellaceae bacterium]|nr:ABC transporter permease [Stellaceae bacterium]
MRTRRAGAAADRDSVAAWQLALGAALLIGWEILGRNGGARWVSEPSQIAVKLWSWLGGSLYVHLYATVTELVTGFLIGTSLGILAGMLLGRSPVLATILRPVIVGLYSVPLVSLAPLFIMFFGLGLMPKIVLVAIVTFFLLFFNTFAGAQRIDEDLVQSLELMGAGRWEIFRKLVAPATAVWIVGGIKIALPYALVATVTGELLATRAGLGYLLSQAAEQFDMTSLYAVLLILMVIGLLLSEAATRIERRVLAWRHAAE